jgi:hypothetical protein
MASRAFAQDVADHVLEFAGPAEVEGLRHELYHSQHELQTVRHILALTLLACGDVLLPQMDRAAAGNQRRNDPPAALLNHLRKELLYLRCEELELPFTCVLSQTGFEEDEEYAKFESSLWEVVEQCSDASDSDDMETDEDM